MEKLGQEITKNKFLYRQMQRNDYAAIYEQYGKAWDGKPMVFGYEVFWIKKQEAQKIKMQGIEIELKEKELFPSDNDFGLTAWSVKKLETAQKIYKNFKYEFINNYIKYTKSKSNGKSKTNKPEKSLQR